MANVERANFHPFHISVYKQFTGKRLKPFALGYNVSNHRKLTFEVDQTLGVLLCNRKLGD
jgi:hypothetical protein